MITGDVVPDVAEPGAVDDSIRPDTDQSDVPNTAVDAPLPTADPSGLAEPDGLSSSPCVTVVPPDTLSPKTSEKPEEQFTAVLPLQDSPTPSSPITFPTTATPADIGTAKPPSPTTPRSPSPNAPCESMSDTPVAADLSTCDQSRTGHLTSDDGEKDSAPISTASPLAADLSRVIEPTEPSVTSGPCASTDPPVVTDQEGSPSTSATLTVVPDPIPQHDAAASPVSTSPYPTETSSSPAVPPALDATSTSTPIRPEIPTRPIAQRYPTRSARRTAILEPHDDLGYEPGATLSRSERVGAALRRWRGELAHAGGPNALLWYRDTPDGTLDLTNAHPTGASMLMAGTRVRLSHLVREAAAFREALATAHRIRAKALELHEDHGLDTAHVCVGMATWEIPGARRRPQAPIMLRTVRLHAVDAAETDLELQLQERVEINPVLLHYLVSEQGIRLDGDALADLAHSTGRFDPLPVYREMRRLLLHVPEFTISDRRVLSTFPMSKMSMVADLAAFADRLSGNDVIAALAGDPAAAQALRADGDGGLSESSRRRGEPDLAREVLVVDADPAQADVIDVARSGRHVLIDAASGTGLTQTLVNIAAALVGSDQRVLVISENSRQLGDLIGHLERAGLSDLVLDARDPHELRHTLPGDILARIDPPSPDTEALHAAPDPAPVAAAEISSSAGDSTTAPSSAGRVDSCARPTNQRMGADAFGWPAPFSGSGGHVAERHLSDLRELLSTHVESMHIRRDPWGVTIVEAQTALAALAAREVVPTSQVRLTREALTGLTHVEVARVGAELSSLAQAGAWLVDHGRSRLTVETASSSRGSHADDEDPWWGASLHTDTDVRRALELVRELSGGRLSADQRALDAALADAGLPAAHSASDWETAFVLCEAVRETLGTFRESVFAQPLRPLIAATDPSSISGARWWSRNGAKKTARSLLLPHAQVDSLYEALCEAERQREDWVSLAGADAEPRLPRGYDAAAARWAALHYDLRWLDEVLAGTRDGASLLDRGLDATRERLALLAASPRRAGVLPKVRDRLDALTGRGLGELLDDLAARRVPADQVPAEVEFVWWRSILEVVAEDDTTYRSHDGGALRDLVDRYVRADHSLLQRRARQVAARAQAHARVEITTRGDQVAALREAARSVKPPRPTRTLLAETGELVAAVAPIWVMSPLTLASMVPTHLVFDVVIIDDAGRMPVAHAVSALARAVRVVAGGDLCGVGPRPFRTLASAEEDEPPSGVPSVLEELARHLPVRHLPRAYDDRDPRIGGFAWQQREDTVQAWPVAGRGPALRLLRTCAVISSVDQDGEAESRENTRIVEAVLDHARRRPDTSLAVLTVTAAQADALGQEIRHALSRDEKAAGAAMLAEDFDERLLVCTVDAAAGRTRHTVIFATGLAPGPGMHLRSPERLQRADGAALIDQVAVIARRRLEIVSALTAADLGRMADVSVGVARLAQLLRHAEADGSVGDEEPVQPLLAEVCARLRQEGLVVRHGYGVGACRLDLVVEDPYDPGCLSVAVLTDGVRHAAVPTVRERERLMPEQLARRGWRTVRVSSTELFRDPARDVGRIVETARRELS
ncbi:hypothetical protein KEM60_01781 [Austwickia sp. TVS 96-490-7B]|nr:hypothetical protein [Austwickia sp. TVS 96-490-7B]